MAFGFSWKSSCSWFRVVGSTYKARLRTMNYGICSCKPKQYSLLRLTTSAWARRLHVHEEPSVSMTCGTQHEMDNWQLPLPIEYLISVNLSPPTTHCAFHRSWSSSHPAAFYQSDLRWGHQRKRQSAESRVQQDEADNQQIDVLRTPEPVYFILHSWHAHQANDHEPENELN